MKAVMTCAGLTLAVLALLVPTEASALLELELGFEPTEACPGDEVQFFFALENVGEEEEVVEFAVTLTFDEMTWGPFEGQFPLAAGEELSQEVIFTVPLPTPPGTLVVTATATDSGGMVEETAELEILECDGIMGGASAKKLVFTFRKALAGIGLR